MSARIVDLTQPITAGMPVYPGDPEVRLDPVTDLATDGCRVAALHLGTHTGTHVDAPAHVVPTGATIDKLDLSLMHGPAELIPVPRAAPHSRVELADLDLTVLRPGDIALLRTDWSRHFGTDHYLAHPHLSPAIADHLIALGVRTIGVDLLSPDPTPAEDLPFHRAFLGAGGVIVENLTNLAAITWPRPTFTALPLPLSGMDGSPVRAIAT